MGSLFGQGKGPPGGLSINTSAANTTTQAPPSASLFPPKSGGSLFGNSTSTAASAGTLFGASTAATQGGMGNTASAPSQAGTLFGGSATATPGAAGGSSLFGNSTQQQPQQQQQQGSMFGSATSSAPSSNPFAALATAKPLGQPAQPTGSLFGSSMTSQPPQSTGLFGSMGGSQPQQQQPQQSTSFFGSLGGSQQPQQQQQPQQGASLFGSLAGAQPSQNNPFGSTQQPQQQQGASLFGAFGQGQGQQQPNPANSLFGGAAPPQPRNTFQASAVSTMGPGQQPQRSIFSASIGQYTQAAQTVPGVRISLDNLRPTTRFEDLHEELQNQIAALDAEVLRQISFADECAHAVPAVARTGGAIPADVAFLEAKLDATRTALVTDAAAIDAAKKQVRADASDASRSFHTIAAVRMPSQLLGRSSTAGTAPAGESGAPAPGDPAAARDADQQAGLVPYFAAQADAMHARLATVQKHLGEVEAYLSGLEAQTAAQVQNLRSTQRNGGRDGEGAGGRGKGGPDERVRELAAVLREFEAGILTVAASVGQAREGVQEAQLAEGNGPRWRR